MKWIALTLIAGIAACDTDETLRSYGAADKTWVLTEIDGTAFTARTTMTFPEKGRIAGKAPCNSYGGTMSWFPTPGSKSVRCGPQKWPALNCRRKPGSSARSRT